MDSPLYTWYIIPVPRKLFQGLKALVFTNSRENQKKTITPGPALGSLGLYLLVFYPGFLYALLPLPQWLGSLLWSAVLLMTLVWIGTRLQLGSPAWAPQIQDLPRICGGVGILIFLGLIIGWWAAFLEPGQRPSFGKGLSWESGVFFFFNLILAAGLEEVFFRWFFFESLQKLGLTWGFAALIQGLFFSLAHGFTGIPWTVFAALSGIFLALVYGKKKRLGTALGVHSLYNLAAWLWF